ncbi:MAG: cyclic nucleotide-binding domain-containing protein [Planctomycetota bacterium]|nr:cyclic nucleotide-binding domain-containing protein [Planctomycetota bacterium]
MNALRKLLHLEPGDGKKALPFFLAFFFFFAFLTLATTARDTLFLSRFQPDFLPYLMVIMAVLTGASVSLVTRISGQRSPFRQLAITFILSAASLFALQPFLSHWLYPVLYVWVQIISTILLIKLWLLTNSSFDPREAKRLIGVIASGNAVASTLLGFYIPSFVDSFGVDLLLPASAVCLLLTLLVLLPVRKQQSPPTKRNRPASTSSKANKTALSPYLRILTITVACSAILGSFVDYEMKILVSETMNEDEMASLFGILYGSIGVVSIFLQIFVTGWALSKLGVFWVLMLLPIFLAAGSGLLLLVPTALVGLLVKAGDQICRFSMSDTASQLLWLPVSPAERNQKKPLIDGSIKNWAKAVAGLIIIGISLFGHTISIVAALSIGFVVLWCFANVRLRSGYVRELSRAIDKRHLQISSLHFDSHDSDVIDSISRTLRQGDDSQKLFALNLLSDNSLEPWKEDLLHLLDTGSPTIRSQTLDLCAEHPDILPDELLTRLIEDPHDDVATNAMLCCAGRKLHEVTPALERARRSDNTRRRAAAAASLVLLETADAEAAREDIEQLLSSPDPDTQLAALSSIGHLPHIVPDDDLAPLLQCESPSIRNKAAQLTDGRSSAALIPPLVQNLADSRTVATARRALRRFDPDLVANELSKVLREPETSQDLLRGVLRTARDYPDHADLASILQIGFAKPIELVTEAANSLASVSEVRALPEDVLRRSEQLLEQTANKTYHALVLCHQFDGDDNAFLIRDNLNNRISKNKVALLQIALLPHPHQRAAKYSQVMASGTQWERANVLELLDNLLPLHQRELLLPLFDDSGVGDKVKKAHRLGANPPGPEHAIRDWLYSDDSWTTVIALDYALKSPSIDQALDWEQIPHLPMVCEVCSQAWAKDNSPLKTMTDFPSHHFLLEEKPKYTRLEKTLFLKSVDIFEQIDGEHVSHIAEIAEERHVPAGEYAFREGDPGQSMFVILSGSVNMMRQGKLLKELEPGDYVGQLALLANAPRVVSALAVTDIVLLEIHDEDFYELMAGRFEVLQSIVRHLSRRLLTLLPNL